MIEYYVVIHHVINISPVGQSLDKRVKSLTTLRGHYLLKRINIIISQ